MATKACFKCKQTYDTKEMTQVFKHWICPNCYDKYITSVGYYKEKFTNEVWGLYDKGNKPSYKQLEAQVEEFHKQYGFTYKGMSLALEYYLRENKWNQDYLLYQAFPKAYNEAQKICKRQDALSQSIPKEIKTEVKTIKSNNVSYKPPIPL